MLLWEKTLNYSNVNCTSRIPIILLTVEKIKRENFDLLLLFNFRFPHA